MRFTKALILDRLEAELRAAGVQVTSLGSHAVGVETDVHTYDATGASVELPEAARPVIAAHDGRTEEELNPLNYASAVPDRPQLKAGVDTIQEYLAKPTAPSAAETVAVVKLLCRALLLILGRLGY